MTDQNPQPRGARTRHRAKTEPVVYVSLIASIIALVLSIVAIGLSASHRNSKVSAQPTASASAPQASANESKDSTDSAEGGTGNPESSSSAAVEWVPQEGSILEGEAYSSMHFKFTKLAVHGKIVTLTMDITNNGDDNSSFYLLSEIYQNGIQVGRLRPKDSGKDEPTLQPGVSTTVQYEGEISDPNTPITIEIDSLPGDQKVSSTYTPRN